MIKERLNGHKNGHKPQVIIEREIIANVDLEATMIGNLIEADVSTFYEVLETGIKSSDFYKEYHRWIFDAIHAVAGNTEFGGYLDMMAIEDAVIKSGNVTSADNLIVELLRLKGLGTTSIASVGQAKEIINYSLKRKMKLAAEAIARMAHDPSCTAADLMDKAEKLVFDVREGHESGGIVRPKELASSFIDYVNESKDRGVGIPSSLHGINTYLKGYRPGKFYLLGGRPGMGKSSLLIGEAEHMARQGVKVAFFSLEMSANEVITRVIAHRMDAATNSIENGKLATSYQFLKEVDTFSSGTLFIDESSKLTPEQLRSKCMRMKLRHGLGAVFVDYIQIMNTASRMNGRYEIVTEISNQLRQLAKDLDVPVIAAVQLSKEVDRRPNKRPVLADLKESGSLEQDAFSVIMVYRDEVYNGEDSEHPNTAELGIVKNRQGKLGIVKTFFEGKNQKIKNADFKKLQL